MAEREVILQTNYWQYVQDSLIPKSSSPGFLLQTVQLCQHDLKRSAHPIRADWCARGTQGRGQDYVGPRRLAPSLYVRPHSLLVLRLRV